MFNQLTFFSEYTKNILKSRIFYTVITYSYIIIIYSSNGNKFSFYSMITYDLTEVN